MSPKAATVPPSAIAPPEAEVVRRLVATALAEDLGNAGDLTSRAVLGTDCPASARIVARQPGVMAGGGIVREVFAQVDPDVKVRIEVVEGAPISSGETVLSISGNAHSLLAGERVALNFLARLCGIATTTHRVVQAVRGTGVEVLCTRKTTPGLRVLEKYAVRCGGGRNHRSGLDDGVLIKDNHLALAGGVRRAVEAARERLGGDAQIQVEVETLESLKHAIDAGADIVLLDNMSLDTLRRAVELAAGRVVLEASGGITLETVRRVAESGVDRVSIGALTHSVRALDLSMEVSPGLPVLAQRRSTSTSSKR